MADLADIFQMLNQLKTDDQIPRRFKESIQEIKEILSAEEEDDDIKINTCLEIVEDFGDNYDLDSYARAKVWSLITKLEELNI
ncbi:MAG: UPF0147 family protein [Candidatus Woesearchaeota archaeon]|nr:MAG: UPF0147 family protein [Candidatus Woesearchaeota archaeon]